MEIKVNVINKSNNELPTYATSGSAGFDFRANLQGGQVVLKPTKRAIIPTGLFMSIPDGYELMVRPRSGLAIKHGITVLNAHGCVDSDYRGEICVILVNLGWDDFVINDGDKIAQGVISPVATALFNVVDELDETESGAGGFGSTDVKKI